MTVQAGGPGTLSALPTYNQSFAYDNLNRLTSATDSGRMVEKLCVPPVRQWLGDGLVGDGAECDDADREYL
jgi:hypothetical protein